MRASNNLIKNESAGSEVNPASKPKVLKNQILAARAEALRIVNEAEIYAAKVRKQAESDAAELKNAAYIEGTENAMQEFQSNLIDSHEVRDRVWRETEKDILRLSVRLAEKIIGQEIKKDSAALGSIVSVALQNARQQERLTVRVNPADLALVEKEIERLSGSERAQFIDFVADPRVSSAGCLIESEVGTIDARLETQLRVLERALLSQSEGEEKN